MLLKRIDGQKPQCGLHCGLALSMTLLVPQELVQAFDCQGIEPSAFADQPLLERRLVEIETFQKFALIEHEGMS
jgi:hypothetical protein